MTAIIITFTLITFTVALMWSLACCDDLDTRTTMGVKLPKDDQ